MNINNNTPSFTSSRISSKDLIDAAKVLNPYFELKGLGGSKSIKELREGIQLNQVGVTMSIPKKDFILFAKDREADNFVSRMLKKHNIEHKYIQDTPETKFDGPIIDLTI